MSPARVRLASGVRWTGPVIAGCVAALAIALVAIGGVIRWAGSLMTPAADPAAANAFDRLLEKHDQTLIASRERFDGRSAFFLPPPPATTPPKEKPKPIDEKPPAPPPPPPPPTEYTGPKAIACIGGTVFFGDGMSLSIGEEKSGVKVVATDAPWTVTLHHLGKDYTVSMLPDSNEKFLNGSLASFGTSTPAIKEVGAKGASGEKPPAPDLKTPDGTSRKTPASAAAPAAPGDAAKPGAESKPGAGSKPAADAKADAGTAENSVPADAASGADAKAPSDSAPASAPSRSPPHEPAGSSAAGGSESGAAPAHGDNAPVIPPALTKEQIDQMDRSTAQEALLAVSRARFNRTLDEATRKRLNQEYTWLRARVTNAGR